MSVTTFKPADIIASRNKHTGELLQAKLTSGSVRSNVKPGDKNNTKPKVYYIPVEFKDVTGAFRPLTLDFAKQLLAAHAKPSQQNEAGTQAKYLNLTFASLRKEDLEKTDYVASQHETFLKQNQEFIEAFDIIVEEYLREAQKIVKFKGAKDIMPAPKNPTIHCPRQVDREAKGDDTAATNERGKINLERPLYRVRLNARSDGTIGGESKTAGRIDTVFDLHKYSEAAAKAKETGKPARKIPARIKTSTGAYVELNINNARHFITYMSMVGGTIRFESIIVSSQGISLRVQVQELHVWHHKIRAIEGISEESLESMMDVQKSTEDEEPEINETVEAPVASAKAPPKPTTRAPPTIDEPDEQDIDETTEVDADNDADETPNVEAEVEMKKTKSAPKAAPGKPAKKKT